MFDPMILSLAAEAQREMLTPEELATFNSRLTGFESLIGLRYTALGTNPEGHVEVTAELEITPQHLQPAGKLHGGVMTAVTESVASVAGLVFSGGNPVVGMSNYTEFLRSVGGSRLVARCIPQHVGRTTQSWRVELFQGGKTERLVAAASVRTLVLNR